MSLEEIAVIIVSFGLGGIVKGAIGVGFPVVAVPILAAWFGVPFAIAVLTVPIIVTNAAQIWQYRAEAKSLPFLWWLVPMAVIGIVIGTWLLVTLHGSGLSLLLAATVMIYLAMRLFRPNWRVTPSAAMSLSPVVGIASGFLQGATGISAPLSLSFLDSMRLARPKFIFAASMLFIAFATTQLISLSYAGVLTPERAVISILAVVPTLAAMPLGSWLGRKFGQATFNRLIFVLLALIAIKLLYGALFGG